MEGLYWHGVAIQERGHKALYAAAGVLAAVLLFMAGGRLMLSVLERQLIYFPSKVSRDAPTPRVSGASTVEEVCPVPESHTRAVPSNDAVTTRLPSGLNLVDQTVSLCPTSLTNSSPVSAFQMRAVRENAVTRRALSGLK